MLSSAQMDFKQKSEIDMIAENAIYDASTSKSYHMYYFMNQWWILSHKEEIKPI